MNRVTLQCTLFCESHDYSKVVHLNIKKSKNVATRWIQPRNRVALLWLFNPFNLYTPPIRIKRMHFTTSRIAGPLRMRSKSSGVVYYWKFRVLQILRHCCVSTSRPRFKFSKANFALMFFTIFLLGIDFALASQKARPKVSHSRILATLLPDKNKKLLLYKIQWTMNNKKFYINNIKLYIKICNFIYVKLHYCKIFMKIISTFINSHIRLHIRLQGYIDWV